PILGLPLARPAAHGDAVAGQVDPPAVEAAVGRAGPVPAGLGDPIPARILVLDALLAGDDAHRPLQGCAPGHPPKVGAGGLAAPGPGAGLLPPPLGHALSWVSG